jgi:uncharacterized RDD family membrane protein YckC
VKDITSPRVLKLKAALFLVVGTLAGALLLAPAFSWQGLGLLLLCIWAFARAYYFAFYVMHHYAEPTFKYAGLLSLVRHLCGRRPPL